MEPQTLTLEQAYKAMYQYFEELYQRTESDELGSLLGDMSLLQDGGTADPAAWHDWMACVKKAIDGDVDAKLRFIDDSPTST